MLRRLPSVISNRSESPPGTITYVGFCLSKKEFWAEMVPTTPGMSALSMDVLSIVTYQLPRGWLKEVAPENIKYMSVTEETSQVSRGWLKEVAPRNMLAMSVTEETSQVSRGWSKEVAPRNIQYMSVTEETSQELRGWSKEAAL